MTGSLDLMTYKYCWFITMQWSTDLELGFELGRGEEGIEDHGSEDESMLVVGCCQSQHMSHIWFTLKINWKFKHASNILDFEIEIFQPKTYQILRLKNQLRPLRLVFAWSLIFENVDRLKTRPQLWSWSVLRISSLDWYWSGLVSVFFQSCNWTFKH